MNESITVTIGCDLGDKYCDICVLHSDGEMERSVRVRTTEMAMRLWFTRASAHVVIEVGTHSRWVNTLLLELGHQVTIANPRRVKLISQSDSKRDRTDAELLARLGRADRQLLAPIEHRGNKAQADLAVAKSRDELIGIRTKLVNHVRGLVKSFGVRVQKCTAASFHKKAVELIPKELKPAIDPILKVLEALAEQIKTHDKNLEQVAKKYPDVEVITC